MSSLDDFWRDRFGQGISNFEEILMLGGARVMTPEEPLFGVFAMMVRILHQTQGQTEKALLQFAPELVSRAQSVIVASDGLERQLAGLQRRAEEFSSALRTLEQRSLIRGYTPVVSRSSAAGWILRNLAPVVTSGLTLSFCLGFLVAAFAFT